VTNILKYKIAGIIAVVIFSLLVFLPSTPLYNGVPETMRRYLPKEPIHLGLDLRGGMHIVLRVDTSKVPEETRADATERAIEVIRNRIDQFGVREPVIQREGADRIIVDLPGVTDIDRAKELIGKTALLEFKLVSNDAQKLNEAIDEKVPEGYELHEVEEHGKQEQLLLEKETVLTGEALSTAFIKLDPLGMPEVGVEFNRKGARKFGRITSENVGRRLAIILDGKVQSAPRINMPITDGKAVITGNFTQDEANDLAIVLRAGALPAPINFEEERVIGPALGKDSIESGIRATLIGSILVLAFMAVYYMLAGLIANFALCFNLLLLLSALSLFHASLTLPGIAGIALTVGMAVDANVLIFERMREESRLGKSIRSVISTGYQKAFSAILDSNLTTLITAAVLFWAGSGPVRGFATTLSIGLIISMFTAIVVTRVIFDLLCLREGFDNVRMLQLMGVPKIDFIGKRKIFYLVSVVVIVTGMGEFIMRGQKNFGVDFTGGTLQEFRFEGPVEIDKVRTVMKEIDLGNVPIQTIGTQKKDIVIRTYADTSRQITEKFKEVFKDNKFEVLRVETVGPVAGRDVTMKAIWAVVLAMAAILAYVAFRFDFKFAVGGVIAVVHDVCVCLGALAITHREISLPVLAALLTIVGYSINDTIVICDRIRENRKLMYKSDLASIANMSINQTMGRTLLTSLTVFLVVLCLYFFGGQVINDFAFVFLVGTITGVYSTVFVAVSMALDLPWGRKK
jgi:SecD/SecF fusion protein